MIRLLIFIQLKANYMWRDLERICQKLDSNFHRPALFPQNGMIEES